MGFYDIYTWYIFSLEKEMTGEIVGTPERIVGLKRASIEGIRIGSHEWETDLDFFAEKFLSLLKQAGLRLDPDHQRKEIR